MRTINKGQEPESFRTWKLSATDTWAPSYRELRDPIKTELLGALVAEQQATCCYCGRGISPDDSHIEHFAPQDTHEDKALAFSNLHASCIRMGVRRHPNHCGHAKGSRFDENRVIHPTDPACEARFRYGWLTGAIMPANAEDTGAAYMIDLLQLDIPYLRDLRRKALGIYFKDGVEQTASLEELEALAEQMQRLDPAGRRRAFGHMLSRRANELLAAHLRTTADVSAGQPPRE